MTECLDQFKGRCNYIYYGENGKFVASTIGCGCCSDTAFDLNKKEAEAVAKSMIAHWQEKLNEIRKLSDERIARDHEESSGG